MMGEGNLYSSYSRKTRIPLVQHILQGKKEREMGNHVIEGLSYTALRPKKTELRPLSPLPLMHKMSSSSLKQMMHKYGFCGFLFVFLTTPCSMQDISFPTRNQTHVSYIGNVKS